MKHLLLSLSLIACTNGPKIVTVEEGTPEVDADGDGFIESDDCDDNDALVNPSASEICDAIDNDCDGNIDEDVLQTFYLDGDQDGFGDPDITIEACTIPDGFSNTGTDCDDSESSVYPSAEEHCDQQDNNCNGEVDEDGLTEYYIDADGDGFGDSNQAIEACDLREGISLLDSDCDDQDSAIFPTAEELCDSIDNDCDGSIDEDVLQLFYLDADGDGFGDNFTTEEACVQPENYTTVTGDCNDIQQFINPNAIEYCDGTDNNCDGLTDETGAIGELTFYQDADFDGFGNVNQTTLACDQPFGYINNPDDCDDSTSNVSPDADELCDGTDHDCNGSTDQGAIDAPTWYIDVDSDGFGSSNFTLEQCTQPTGYVANNTDCNDILAAAYPNATEVCDGADNNCNGLADDDDANLDLNTATTFYTDLDGDGFGDSASVTLACYAPSDSSIIDGDCDDSSIMIYPFQLELCDSIDNNCDGFIDESGAFGERTYYQDLDSDGYGDLSQTTLSCSQPSGYIDNSDDCDDSTDSISPDADELCDGTDHDCDGSTDLGAIDAPTWYIDVDSDGFGSSSFTLEQCTQPTGYVANNTDCNDILATAYPNATEVCDGADNDCDGAIDDDDLGLDLNTATTFYTDLDGDGFGNLASSTLSCALSSGQANNSDDCDDSNIGISPNATEICDAIDNNCDGSVDEGVFGTDPQCAATDCADIASQAPAAIDGSYWIDTIGSGSIEVYCDMGASGGPMTYLQYSDVQTYWSFDSSSGLTADIGAATGTLQGNSSISATVPFTGFGDSLYADNNESGRANISNGPTFNGDWTVSFWAMNDNCSNNQIPIIFDDYSFMGDLYHNVALYYASGGYYALANHNSACTSYQNNWRHFAYRNNGVSLQVWENGVEITARTSYLYHNFAGRSIIHLMNRPSWSTNGLGGYMDDLVVIDAALDEADILNIYNYGTNGYPLRWQ